MESSAPVETQVEPRESGTSEAGVVKEAKDSSSPENLVPAVDPRPTAVRMERSSGTDKEEPSSQPALQKGQVNPANIGMENEVEKDAIENETTAKEAQTAFVNEGLIRWEAARHLWLGDRETGSDDSGSSVRPTAVPLDVDKIIDILFYSSTREARATAAKPEKFPRNVPLPQMIDILQDLWEAEGLDA